MKRRAVLVLTFLCMIMYAHAQITNALLVVPQNTGAGPTFSDNCYEQALDNLGIPYQSYLELSDIIVFTQAVANADPANTLIIIDSWFLNPFDWSGTAGLGNWINAGGRIIFSSWTMAGQSIRFSLGVNQVTNDLSDTYTLYNWGGSNLFQGTGNSLVFEASSFMVGVASNTRMSMTPMAGADALGGFIPNINVNGEAGIILANNGRTIALGGCLNLVENRAQCEVFAENLIRRVVSGPIQAIPNMSQWGMTVLFLLMMIVTLVSSQKFIRPFDERTL